MRIVRIDLLRDTLYSVVIDTEDDMKTRVIRTAAALDKAFSNPQLCAFNRVHLGHSKTERGKQFWREVASVLDRPYRCQSWTQEQSDNWNAIRAAQ